MLQPKILILTSGLRGYYMTERVYEFIWDLDKPSP